MSTTKIEWTDATWNPVTGCTKVSAGCANCYAERMAKRLQAMGQQRYQNGFELTCHPEVLKEPLRWRKPRRVFVCSMADLFHEGVPNEFIAQTWAIMARCEQHTFQVLTKRIARAATILGCEGFRERVLHWLIHSEEYYCGICCTWYEFSGKLTHCPNCGHEYSLGDVCPSCGEEDYELTCPKCGTNGGSGGLICACYCESEIENSWLPEWPLPNVWLGTSVEDQATANERIPHLLKCPASLHFLSVEPMLAPVELMEACGQGMPGDIGWVICGSESGPKRRPTKLNWVRDLRDQCIASGIPFFLKQMEAGYDRLTKLPKLDGRVWDQMPEVVDAKGQEVFAWS